MSPQEFSSPSINQRIDLRVQAKVHTPAGETYSYLIRNPEWGSKKGKAMLNQAVQDYWLPYARLSADPSLAKTTALACIERMEYQIAKLRQDFGLEPPDRALLDQSELRWLLLQLVTEVQMIPQSLAAISTAIASGGVAQPPPVPPIAAVTEPPPVPPIAAVTEPPPASPIAVVTEPTEPAKNDLYSAENMMAVFDMIGSPAENLNTDPND